MSAQQVRNLAEYATESVAGSSRWKQIFMKFDGAGLPINGTRRYNFGLSTQKTEEESLYLQFKAAVLPAKEILNPNWVVTSMSYLFSAGQGQAQSVHSDYVWGETGNNPELQLPGTILVALSEFACLDIYGRHTMEVEQDDVRRIYIRQGDALPI